MKLKRLSSSHVRPRQALIEHFRAGVTALICLCHLSCGDQILGSKEQLSELATLKVELLPPFEPLSPEGPMRLGVLWLDVSSPDAWCSLNASVTLGLPPSSGFGSSEGLNSLSDELLELTNQVCRDPLGVSPGLAGESVEVPLELIQSGGVVELPFTRLPSAEVLFGSPDARLGYATIVLFEDLNRDGALTIGEPEGRRRGRRRRPSEERPPPDRVWGASFKSLTEPHQRLVYREGAPIETPFFYPTIGCEQLPQGFGVIESTIELLDLFALLSPYLERGEAELEGEAGQEGGAGPEERPTLREGLCRVWSLDEALQVQVEPPSERLQELVCEPLEDEGEEPPDDEPKPGLQMSCVSATEVLATEEGGRCKAVQYWRLVGCPLQEPDCEQPRWDMRSNVPSWWPCDEGSP